MDGVLCDDHEERCWIAVVKLPLGVSRRPVVQCSAENEYLARDTLANVAGLRPKVDRNRSHLCNPHGMVLLPGLSSSSDNQVSPLLVDNHNQHVFEAGNSARAAARLSGRKSGNPNPGAFARPIPAVPLAAHAHQPELP